MNIREAKSEIIRTVEMYLDKNEFGEYTIPVSRQRPIFMTGAPGIGKTAVIQQIASELDLALVSGSMRHHTRQSAQGRPVIKARDHDGTQICVSEYTISEIIAAVYRVMEDSGKKEGILFLDEINCAPEALEPAVRQFLRYKTLGNRQVPEGWVVVTAGSRPEYSRSVKEFDMAVMDRLKRMDITEDISIWKQYAFQQGIHAAVIMFLETHPQWFYSVRSMEEGMRYVTARGWEDLSTATRLYEEKGFEITGRLTGQYITDEEIAEEFGISYGLYRKCKADYRIADILSGKAGQELIEKSQRAERDERYSILGLILEMLGEGFRKSASRESSLQMVERALGSMKKGVKEDRLPVSLLLQEQTDRLRERLRERAAANSITAREREEYLAAIRTLAEYKKNPDTGAPHKDLDKIKKQFGREVRQHEKQNAQVKSMLEAALSFLEEAWGKNQQEMAFFLTALTSFADNPASASQWVREACFQYEQEQGLEV